MAAPMDVSRLSALRRHYDYDLWAGTKRGTDDLHVWRFAFAGTELADCRAVRIEPQPQPRAVREPPPLRIDAVVRPTDAPPRAGPAPPPLLVKSFWQPDDSSHKLFNVDVYECGSRLAAHELLLRLLGEFSRAALAREQDADVGDVLFVVPGNTALVFARANLVHVVRNASRNAVDVLPLARNLDRRLVHKPAALARAKRLRASVPLGRVRWMTEPTQAGGSALYYKLFVRNGTIAEEHGELVYRIEAADTAEIEVVATYADQDALYQAFKLKR